MALNWFESLLYGLISGFTEFLPVSSEAHGILLTRILGVEDAGSGLCLAVHLGALLALLLSCRPQLSRLSRERRIAAMPARRRKRQPDANALMDIRLLKTAAFPLLLAFLAYPWVGKLCHRLWILGLALMINGILLYVPQFMPGANKDSRTLSRLDGLLIGLGGALAVMPGISRLGATMSVSAMRGTERQYSLHTALMLCIPALALLVLINLAGVIASGFAGITAGGVLSIITAGGAAAVSAYFSILLMRFLMVKAGFSGFAYYCWGTAMFAFILYLAI